MTEQLMTAMWAAWIEILYLPLLNLILTIILNLCQAVVHTVTYKYTTHM